MLKQEVKDVLAQKPFVPLRIHLKDGRSFDVPFLDVVRLLSYGVLVFIGLKEGTRQARSYDRFPFDQIETIEQRPSARRRKKAS